MLHNVLLAPGYTVPTHAIFLLGVPVVLGIWIAWRDWDRFEIVDWEMAAFLIMGILWGSVYGRGMVDTVSAALFLGVPVLCSWLYTRKAEVQPFADGDIMLAAAVGAWAGWGGMMPLLVWTIATNILIAMIAAPRVYYARKRVSMGELADIGDKYRPVQYNQVPMAPVVMLALGIVLYHLIHVRG